MSKTTQPLILLKATIQNIYQHPVILYPTIVLALLQFLALEILYFAPRYPLSKFFGPLISRIWSEDYLHYPMDLVLLPKLFYYAQLVLYLFVGAFLMAVTAHLILTLNSNRRANLGNSFREVKHFYPHILCAAVLYLGLFQVASSAYIEVLQATLKFKASNEMVVVLQKLFISTSPYIQFFIGILVTTLLIHIIPIIVIEKKKFLRAVGVNLSVLRRSFGASFLVVLIPTLFFLPLLVLRNHMEALANATIPEIQIFIIVLGVPAAVAIDMIVLTTITTHYLYLKEDT